MSEEKVTKLTYEGEDRKLFIITTNRSLKLRKGDVVEFNEKELAEVIKQPRSKLYFKELKPKKESTKPGGDD